MHYCLKKKITQLIILFLLVIVVQKGAAQIKVLDIPEDQRLKGQIYNIQFAPSNPSLIAYERLVTDKQEIYLYNISTSEIQKLTALSNDKGETGDIFLDLLHSSDIENLSYYEGQLDWRPVLDSRGRQWFVFISSGKNKGYDLYLSYIDNVGRLNNKEPLRLRRKGTDQFPKWSPDGNSLVFVGEGEKGMDLYFCDNMREILSDGTSRKFHPQKLIKNSEEDCYPSWSPDGRYIAFQSEMIEKGIKNIGIDIIDMDSNLKTPVRLTGTLNSYNEYKPSWSHDGRYIAFYIDHNPINSSSEDQLQDISVVQIVRSVTSNKIIGGKVIEGFSKRLAENILPKRHSGPVWYAIKDKSRGSMRNLVIYVAKDEKEFNPIILKDFSTWRKRKQYKKRNLCDELKTKLNHELCLSSWPSYNILAYVAQKKDINTLVIASLGVNSKKVEYFTIPMEISRISALARSAVLPGLGQFYKKQKVKGSFFTILEAAAVTGAIISHINTNKYYNDTESFKKQYYSAVLQKDFEQAYQGWESSYNNWESAKKTRNTLAVVAVGIWGLNILDSVLGFPRTIEKRINLPENLSLSVKQQSCLTAYKPQNPVIMCSLKLSF